MAIEAELPDGTILEFPDGTPDDVIDRTVREQLGATESGDISAAGVASALGTAITGAIAEPLAGAAGSIVASPTPTVGGLLTRAFGADPAEVGANITNTVRDALTLNPTPEGQQALAAAGNLIPDFVTDATEALSNAADTVGSVPVIGPTLGAAARTLPVAAAELFGFGAARAARPLVQSGQRVNRKAVRRAIERSAPSAEQLKASAGVIYDELEASGITMRSAGSGRLFRKLSEVLEDEGVTLAPQSAPKAMASLRAFQRAANRPMTLPQLDRLRKTARMAERSIDPDESRIGGRMVRTIDEALDNMKPTDLDVPKGVRINVSESYRTARDMWGRIRRSELIERAVERAKGSASGFENGIRSEFRSLLDPKGKNRSLFRPDEIAAMEAVRDGTRGANIFRLLGKTGVIEGGTTRIVGPAIGSGVGLAAFGPAGVWGVPLIGQMSKSMAQRLTRGNAQFADSVIRAGRDGQKRIEAYLKHTRSTERRAEDMAQLLHDPRIDLDSIVPRSQMEQRAIGFARRNRDALSAAAGAGALASQQQQQQSVATGVGIP